MLKMPEPNAEVIGRRAEIARALREIVSDDAVIDDATGLRPYESDGLTAYRQPPMLVVLPETVEQVSRTLRYCHDNGIRVVPRGAGTSLSGGALPLADAVLLGMARFNRILEVDHANRCAVVQPGVTNLSITQAVADDGFYYAPDPSSQIACSIGGNVAENSGGVHCLKYGLTTNNVLGVEMVLIDGTVIRLGGKALDAPGYDLLGLAIGSEGMLGVVTEVTVRLLRAPETARALLLGFPSAEAAGDTVGAIIAAGIVPGGMEMMDTLAIQASDDFVHAGYPRDVEALLIVELDGPGGGGRPPDRAGRGARPRQGRDLRPGQQGRGRARGVLVRPQERLPRGRPHLARLLLHGRHHPARTAAGGFVENFGNDGKVWFARCQRLPRRRRQPASADPLRRQQARRAGQGGGVRRRDPQAVRRGRRRADRRARRRRREARPYGGDVHRNRSEQQQRVKCAFDPDQLLNPGKVFPTLHRCAELGRVHVHGGQTRFPDIPQF